MMLPTDIALTTDAAFKPWVEKPVNFCRTLFQIERAALHSYGPEPHSC